MIAPGSTYRFVILAIWLGCAGCKSGATANPFQAAPTRVPAPPTRSFQTNGNYYNSPPGTGTVPGAPGAAVGTGITSGTNWSSSPNAVNSANTAGVYTSWLERTGSGYSVRTAPSGTTPPPATAPATPGFNTRSSAPVDPRYPTSTFADPGSTVQPAQFQQPLTSYPPTPTVPSSSTIPQFGEPPPYVPPSEFTPSAPPANGGNLIWRTPRP